MDYVYRADITVSGRADRFGVLRRLCEDNPAERGRRKIACQTAGAGYPGIVCWRVPLEGSGHAPIDHGYYGAFLQISGCIRLGFAGVRPDDAYHRWKLE